MVLFKLIHPIKDRVVVVLREVVGNFKQRQIGLEQQRQQHVCKHKLLLLIISLSIYCGPEALVGTAKTENKNENSKYSDEFR